MPLDKGCSIDAFRGNVRASYKEGKTAKGTQHVAIAISTLKRACGVADDDRKMTPKEIVAAGSKGESRSYVSLLGLMEREASPSVGPKWFGAVAEAATEAVREAEIGKRGPATDQLLSLIHALVKKRVVAPTFESLHRGADDWGPWRGWVSRVMYAAENVAVPELGALVRAYVRGETRVPARSAGSGLAERTSGSRLDFAARSSAHGAATSPSSAPPEANSGANVGTFQVFADDGDIKTGDGRAPKKRKR